MSKFVFNDEFQKVEDRLKKMSFDESKMDLAVFNNVVTNPNLSNVKSLAIVNTIRMLVLNNLNNIASFTFENKENTKINHNNAVYNDIKKSDSIAVANKHSNKTKPIWKIVEFPKIIGKVSLSDVISSMNKYDNYVANVKKYLSIINNNDDGILIYRTIIFKNENGFEVVFEISSLQL